MSKRMKQARSYDCAVQDWIDVWVHGKEQRINRKGWYGERVYAGNNGQIFSYGSHFEMARVLTDNKGKPRLILINGERASVTTTKHQGYVRAAVSRSGIPSIIIPYGALQAANIDIGSINAIDVETDKWLTIKHESERPPRWAEYVDAPVVEEGEWSDEEVRRWNDWHDWSKHANEIDDKRNAVKRGIEAWNEFSEDDDHDYTGYRSNQYWLEKLPENYRDLQLMESEPPRDLGKPTGYMRSRGDAYRPSPPNKLVPTGERVKGYVHKDKVGRLSGALADGTRYAGVMPGRELHEPDEDGQWRWTTRRHILGESLIEADVNAWRNVTCEVCDGDKLTRSPLPTSLPRGRNVRWTYGENIIERIDVPIPYAGPHNKKWNEWTSIEKDVCLLPLPRMHYDCSTCRGTGKVRQPIKRRKVKFLSGFDHGEPHLAYFFCEMPKCDATTVAEAYEALKPDVVKLAEQMGRNVVRQGDIFAIETTLTTKELMAEAKEHGVRHRGKAARLLKLEPAAHRIAEGQEHWNYRRLDKPVPLYREQALLDKKVQASMLLGTNHQGTEVIHAKDGTIYAKGCMWHVPDGRTNDHVRKKLGDGKTWHIICKNRVPVRKER